MRYRARLFAALGCYAFACGSSQSSAVVSVDNTGGGAPASASAGTPAPVAAVAGTGGRAGAAGMRATAAGVAARAAGMGAGRSTGASGAGGAVGGAGSTAAGSGGAGASAAVGGSGGSAGGPAAESCSADAAAPEKLALTGDLGTHDPSVIERDGMFYEFQTGPGLPIKRSRDLRAWEGAGRVFTSNPGWIAQRVSGVQDLWAPDISHFGGQYHVYYAASTPGSNRSCIGHATSAQPDSGWMDQGAVICSNSGNARDDWNAIDANLILDDAGQPHLVFGSFWGGLKMIDLDESGARSGDSLTAVAARPMNNGALEAPYIVKRCGWYYLFVSFDRCCEGANSTYNIHVGRSKELKGPYADDMGTPMLQGGGKLLVKGDDTWKGPGHNAVLFTGGRFYNIYHAYYAGSNSGMYRRDGSFLRISELAWDADGWPTSAGP